MKRSYVFALFFTSAIFSFWLYNKSDRKIERALTANEWQTHISGVLNEHHYLDTELVPLRHLKITANVRYLPNGDYFRESSMKWSTDSSNESSVIKISEFGTWKVTDHYLLVSPHEFKDTSVNPSEPLTKAQLAIIMQFLKTEAQQSRRVDIVNNKTLLLTNLSQESSLLFSH